MTTRTITLWGAQLDRVGLPGSIQVRGDVTRSPGAADGAHHLRGAAGRGRLAQQGATDEPPLRLHPRPPGARWGIHATRRGLVGGADRGRGGLDHDHAPRR